MRRRRARGWRTWVLAACVAASFAGATALAPREAFAQRHEEIALAVGETKTLPATGVKEYSEGVKGVVDVVPTPDGKTFVLTGRRAGTTTLLLIRNDGTQTTFDVSVANRNPSQVEREIMELTKDIAGIKTRRVGSRIFLEGGVSSEADLKRVQQVAQLYAGQAESLVVVGAPGDRKLLIRLDFFFVQYERTSGYQVGVGWPSSIGGAGANGTQVFQDNYSFDFVTRTTTTANASIVNQPLPRLDVAEHHGWAKVLKQSSVITSNGSEATFQNGGEQNFLQSVGLTVGLVSVKFGTNVTVLPRYDSNTRDVEIKLVSDVADLTDPTTSGGPPGRTTTRLDTNVTLKLGQALVLSGIKTASARHNVSGLPGLDQVPILGLLFASHGQEKAETEGAVFIVPSIVDTVPKSAVDLINNAMATYKDYQGELEYVDTYPKTPPSSK